MQSHAIVLFVKGFIIRHWPPFLQILFFFLMVAVESGGWIGILLLFSGLSPRLIGSGQIPAMAIAIYTMGLYGLLLLNIYLFQIWRGESFWNLSFIHPKWGSQLIKGIALGGFLWIMLCFFHLIMKWLIWQPIHLSSVILTSLLMAFAFAFIEELLFRGWILHVLKTRWPSMSANLFQSGIFALVHFLKPEWHPRDLLFFIGLFATGLLLGCLREKTDSLWMPMGVHMSWIYFISVTSQLRLFQLAPDTLLITGGYNPVAGLSGIIFLIGWVIWECKGHLIVDERFDYYPPGQ